MGPISEEGLKILFLGLIIGYALCMADWYWFARWKVFEGTAIYLFILAVWAAIVAAILTILGY